jgi:hypothetical protein
MRSVWCGMCFHSGRKEEGKKEREKERKEEKYKIVIERGNGQE